MENSAYFSKRKVGDWENYLTQEMAKKLDAVVEEKLEGSGLFFALACTDALLLPICDFPAN
uniref:Sulfotransferase n=1 Tax=Leersia perrieri TaxID=77586 RepID=A0A0D9VRL8_9ORYZ